MSSQDPVHSRDLAMIHPVSSLNPLFDDLAKTYLPELGMRHIAAALITRKKQWNIARLAGPA